MPTVTVYLAADALALLDQKRGKQGRGKFIATLLETAPEASSEAYVSQRQFDLLVDVVVRLQNALVELRALSHHHGAIRETPTRDE